MAIIVYDTKKQKSYPIHPSMAKDKAWMSARGLIIEQPAKPFVATNMPAEPVATPTAAAKPTQTKSPK